MKIRAGHVSNSSSSSFVVNFKEIPTSVEHLKQMMFGDLESISWYDYHHSTIKVAERVFADISKQMPNDFNNISEHIDIPYSAYETRIEGFKYFDTYKMDEPKRSQWLAKFDALSEELKKKDLENLCSVEGFIYCFEYADDGGEALLEHGGIFNNILHKQYSRH